jgi:NitT/TauT family transport system ATP-binding protein
MLAGRMQPRSDARPRGTRVRLSDVHRVFHSAAEGRIEAVAGVTLAIEAGEFVALLGPSGSGKSTLLRLVAGLDRPDSGSVALDDHDPTRAPRPAIGFVFQDAHLLPWRDVLGNVELPLELLGVPQQARRAAAHDAIRRVGLDDAIRRAPSQLSGGMRMRVSLARALVIQPRLLLLDEPFAALDEITRAQLDEDLRRLWADTGITVLFVTHSTVEAAFLAARAVVLTGRPARVALDRRLDLPVERASALRSDARFANELRVLQDALRPGGEAP